MILHVNHIPPKQTALAASVVSTLVTAASEGIPPKSGNWVMKQSVTASGGTRMYVYSAINNIYRTGNPL